MPQNLFYSIIFFLAASYCLKAQEVVASEAITVSAKFVYSEPVPSEWKGRFSFPEGYNIDLVSDFDHDGLLDYLEYYADTDPTDSSSKLQIVDTQVQGNNLVISWTSSANDNPESREYTIFRAGADNLGILVNARSIEDLQDISGVEEIGPIGADSGPITTYPDIGAAASTPLFYRVFLSQPLPK